MTKFQVDPNCRRFFPNFSEWSIGKLDIIVTFQKGADLELTNNLFSPFLTQEHPTTQLL